LQQELENMTKERDAYIEELEELKKSNETEIVQEMDATIKKLQEDNDRLTKVVNCFTNTN